MSKIKNFESFVNEELSPEVYKDAADKLRKKGHKSRAEKLDLHAKEQVKPITLEMYGEVFNLDHRNFVDVYYKPTNKGFVINLDLSKPSPNWDDDSISEEENEERDMNQVLTIVDFYPDKNDKSKLKGEVSGIVIPDRVNARKFLNYIKDYFKYYGGPLAVEVEKLTVNDFYTS